jgi:hypothetical protein
MKEHAVRAHLHARIKELGGEHRAIKYLGRRHAPDDLVLLPGRSVWVEGKRPQKWAEPGQAREHERLRAAGCEVVTLNTIEAIDAYFPPPESSK